MTAFQRLSRWRPLASSRAALSSLTPSSVAPSQAADGPLRGFLWLPVLILAGGLLTTGLFCHSQRHFRQLEHERIERTLAADITQAIQTRIETNTAILDAVVGLFSASTQVTSQEFTNFISTLQSHRSHLRGIQGVGFAAVVPDNDSATFERLMRSQGLEQFQIRPAGQRNPTTAIVYLQPNDWRNQRAIGFDMYSEPTRRQAMAEAAATGETQLSGPVRLVQETENRPQAGMLLYSPVYRDVAIDFRSPQDRLQRLVGWAYSPLRMEDLISSALETINNPDLNGTGVLVYDGERQDAKRLLFDNLGLASSDRLNHPTWQTVPINNRRWLIGIQLDHRKPHPSGWSPEILLTGLLGMAISSLAAILSQRLVASHLALREALGREQLAARERALAAAVFDNSPVAIVVTDPDGFILQVNQAFTQLSGYSALETRGRKTNLLRSGRHDPSFYQKMWEEITQKGHWSGEVWNLHRNGQIRRHDLNITAVLDGRDQIVNFVGLLRDVTDRHSQEERMRFLAGHDQLTGLANRARLTEQLKRDLALAERYGHGLGVLYLDLDGFKPVNDRFGHAVGDRVLQVMAARMQRVLRKSDLLCRQGGDEFVVLISEAGGITELAGLARKLVAAIEAPLDELRPEETAQHTPRPSAAARRASAEGSADSGSAMVQKLSASVGVARYPDHGRSADDLLSAADHAMYRAKQTGDCVCVAVGFEARA